MKFHVTVSERQARHNFTLFPRPINCDRVISVVIHDLECAEAAAPAQLEIGPPEAPEAEQQRSRKTVNPGWFTTRPNSRQTRWAPPRPQSVLAVR